MGRIAAATLGLTLALSSCTGSSDPSESRPTPSVDETPGAQPRTDGWDLLRRRACADLAFRSPDVPAGVVAWAPIDACRVVIAGDFGVALVVSGRVVELSADTGRVHDFSALAVDSRSVWVGGLLGDSQPVAAVLRVARSGTKIVPTGTASDYSLGLASYRGGVLHAVGVMGRPTRVLWLRRRSARLIATLPRSTGLLSVNSESLAGTTSGRTPDRVFGGPPNSVKFGPEIPLRSGGGTASANGSNLLVGVNLIGSGGAATSVRFYWSTDAGRTWRSSSPSDLIEVGSSAVSRSGEFFASMATQDGENRVFRSSDAKTWRAVTNINIGESSARLATAADGTVWLLSDRRLLRIG